MEPSLIHGCHRRGLSLIESLLAIVVLEMAVLAVGFGIAAGQDQAARANDGLEGIALAEDLMERILGLPYDDPEGHSRPGPETGEKGVGAFDNTDDYDRFADTVPSRSSGGAPFRRSVRTVAGRAAPSGLAAPVRGLTITVTVQQAPAGRWTLVRFVPEGSP